MPAGFRRHHEGKTLRHVFHSDIAEIRFASDRAYIFINQPIECCVNDSTNLRSLTPHIMPCYTHKKLRSYRGRSLCDITSPYVYTHARCTAMPSVSPPGCATSRLRPASDSATLLTVRWRHLPNVTGTRFCGWSRQKLVATATSLEGSKK